MKCSCTDTRSKQYFALSVHLVFCRTTDEGRCVAMSVTGVCTTQRSPVGNNRQVGRFGVFWLWDFFGGFCCCCCWVFFILKCPFLPCLFQNSRGTMTDLSKHRAARRSPKHRERLCALCFSTAFALQLISHRLLLDGQLLRASAECFGLILL